MPTRILMPALSPTMEEGTLAKWLVKEGDSVAPGDLLAEIETDKAVMEFEAVDEGVIGRLLVAEGSEGVKVNTPIALLLEEGESADAAADTAPAPDTAPGTPAAPDAAPARPAGTAAATPAPATKKPPEARPGRRLFATPLARRLAAERGIDLATVTGSGPHGRIIKADIEAAGTAPAVQTPPGSAPAPAPAAASPDAESVMALYADRPFEELPLDGMRRTVAARLGEAKRTIPHFYLRREVHIDRLLALRSKMNKSLEQRGIKLSVNDFIIKACALALQQVPACNAVWAGDRILRLKPSDIAVAVAVEGGLFTPILRDAETKTLSTLSGEMKDLAQRARNRRLKPQEYQGGSFAISNLGMYGIDSFDAVINPPHGAILAVGAGVKKPVVGEDGELTVATVMSLTLSVDHRVIDGALGAEFLDALGTNLQQPLTMLA